MLNKNQKIGILVTNLGSPESPNKVAVKRFLKDFLSDKLVIEAPLILLKSRIIWLFILNFIILNIRTAKTTEKYKKIWGNKDLKAPLVRMSASLLEKISKNKFNVDYELEFALGMRYSSPSIENALNYLKSKGCIKIVALSLYPQYSKTTTTSNRFEILKYLSKWQNNPELCFITDYHSDDLYIKTLASSIREFQKIHGVANKLLISYHSIPERYVKKCDCYFNQCQQTTRLLAKELKLAPDQYEICFQSVFGKEKWVGPNISYRLKELASDGVSYVQVVCPGFPVDCLETLEEIKIENKEVFIANGGKRYEYIPALNDSDEHVNMLSAIITRQIY